MHKKKKGIWSATLMIILVMMLMENSIISKAAESSIGLYSAERHTIRRIK